jgi:hypothetical protein
MPLPRSAARNSQQTTPQAGPGYHKNLRASGSEQPLGIQPDLGATSERIWDGTCEVQWHIISRALLRPLGG